MTPDSLPRSPQEGAETSAQKAERELYRSWREGKAKMNGMTIAQSQRKPSKLPHFEVEKVIAAQLPQPEPLANARSRKASHYLGLFKENADEKEKEKEDGGRKRSGQAREASKSQLARNLAEQADEQDREQTIQEDLEDVENGNAVTVSRDQMAHKLPLGLLEEIRNHHQLAPGPSPKKIPYSQHMTRDEEKRRHDQLRKQVLKKDEDDDSDREHISSATYFPHQGVKLGDSPVDDPAVERTPKQKPVEDDLEQEKAYTNDVQLSLQGQGAPEVLQGTSRAASVYDFKTIAKPASMTPEEMISDSEYESAESGYESTVSGGDQCEETVQTTPTATPLVKPVADVRSHRRRSHEDSEPVGTVELTPYKHQVGGHTSIYRFSRKAVCKQLNSKENMFYETVEKRHPDLLNFMPRYIGVLNVTYRKEQKKRKHTLADESRTEHVACQDFGVEPYNGEQQSIEMLPKRSDHARVISHSMQNKAPAGIPQVVFANNRHLIPDSLFARSKSVHEELHRTRSTPQSPQQPDEEGAANENPRRPSLKPAASWGFTSVNDKLRDRVLREVFTPPVIHKHRRHERTYQARSLRKVPQSFHDELAHSQRQDSVDVASLQRVEQAKEPDMRKLCFKIPLERQLSNENRSASDLAYVLRQSNKTLSKSAEANEVDAAAAEEGQRNHRRRHSGGGLMRKPTDIEGNRGDLEFHEDEAYTADGEEDVFAMDDVKKDLPMDGHAPATGFVASSASGHEPIDAIPQGMEQSWPRLGPAIDFGLSEPRNPETSLVQHDERVEHFLLLEDLTSGMQKPCVLDLKMGTRQYGVEANEKKQKSQRQKCKQTTSRQLGVRVCGMQVYNVREQKYDFEDKYYGRDLRAGEEFFEALKRFFFDGIGHAQALKHIPTVLEKINHLEKIIRELPGYRLYASSLLLIYDRGDADTNGKVKNPPGRPDSDKKSAAEQYPHIKLKIVDFANCVTAESLPHIQHKPCPPRSPDQIDRGYLRGLRSLRLYFQRIYQDLHHQKYVERGESEGMAIDQRGISMSTTSKGWSESVMEDDPGEVSV